MILKGLQLLGTGFIKKNEKENRAKLLKDHHPRSLISPCQSNGPHPPTCKSVLLLDSCRASQSLPDPIYRSIENTHPPTSLDAYSYAIQPARGVQVCFSACRCCWPQSHSFLRNDDPHYLLNRSCRGYKARAGFPSFSHSRRMREWLNFVKKVTEIGCPRINL